MWTNSLRWRAISDDVPDEAVAALGNGFYVAGIVRVVSKSLAELSDGSSQRVGRDERSRPDAVEQFVLGDQPIPARDEKPQHVEDLRFDVDHHAGAPHRHPAEID